MTLTAKKSTTSNTMMELDMREHNAMSRKELLNQLIDNIELSIEQMDAFIQQDGIDLGRGLIYSLFTDLLEKLEDELCRITEDPEFV